jgi:hypothetical protein
MERTNLVIAFFVAAVVAGLLLRFHLLSGPAPSKENFMQKPLGAPVSGSGMGPYDQVSQSGGVSGWAATEGMPVGAMPQNVALDSNQLMFLVGNTVDSSCCPSAFTTDTGCVCLTGADQTLMAHRGGNK